MSSDPNTAISYDIESVPNEREIYRKELQQVTAQRDELLAALKDLRNRVVAEKPEAEAGIALIKSLNGKETE